MRIRHIVFGAILVASLLPQTVLSADGGLAAIRFGQGALAFSAGYIRPGVTSDGQVTKTPNDRQLLGQGDSLFLNMLNPDDVTLGARYTVYRKIHKVYHPTNRRYLGELISIIGIVRITAIDQNLATALIEQSFSPIAAGDAIVPYEPPRAEEPGEPAQRSLPETPGTIIDIQMQRTLVGQSNVVYVDWGRDDGLRIGDTLDVFRIRAGLPPQIVGEMTILALEDRTATALIKRSAAPIVAGDRFTVRETAGDIAHELQHPSPKQ